MDLNLETLKSEILDYLAASEFAVFRSHSGGLDSLPIITWDTERFPDYRMFLETAHKAGQKLILFAAREFEEAEVEEAAEEMQEIESSSRLYKEEDTLFLTAPFLYGVDNGEFSSTAITFVLANANLIAQPWRVSEIFRLFKGI